MAARQRGALTLRVTERLRQAIIDGEVELGDALSEDKLATKLGVSRSPVHEALTALEQQGLIDIKPQRGSFVFLPTREDIENLCEFRRMIETEALHLAMRRGRDATLAALKAAAHEMHEAIRAGDDLRSAHADTAFHAAPIENSGNSYLINAYRLVSGKVAALRSHRSTASIRSEANTEHFEIIARLEESDLPAALGALSNHILKMAKRYDIEPSRKRATAGRAARTPSLEHFGPLLD
ncbi:GntR family transcriptional regulator [Bosea sp. F3-2]|uniref:GntR family transcriptional regulator n=1 Tax=Bosea sp. F3-2 TaxID=2599640 RepID=UPI00165513F2|nr:GntR family transcriptional regulator [Bosea sp. F3-2]